MWPSEPKDVDAKYVFLDIVEFTANRTIEAQSAIIKTFNDIVSRAVEATGRPYKQRPLYIPTGDGLCVAFIHERDPFDIHIRTALQILEFVEEHNAEEGNPMRQFQVRIGLNENRDNLVQDINGRDNLAGSGISRAQRVMDLADARTILVGQTVFERLNQRESYFGKFVEYSAVVRHGAEISVFQFTDSELPYLSSETPQSLASQATGTRPLETDDL